MGGKIFWRMSNFSVRYSPRVLIQEGYLKTRNLNMVAQLFTSIEGMDTVRNLELLA